jgi:hypothetical protein
MLSVKRGSNHTPESRAQISKTKRRQALEAAVYRERARREAEERAAGEVSLREVLARS